MTQFYKEKEYNLKEVYKKAKNGDESAKVYLLNYHKPLVISLLKKYRICNSEKEDLLSCANMGLIKAINKYDESYNTEFSTYAVPLILGEIRKYYRDNGIISVSRSIKENYKKIIQYENSKDYSPTIEELCLHLNMSKEDILEALESNYTCFSLDSKMKDNDDITYLDAIADIQDNKDIDLYNAINKLDKIERMIIELRYFDGLTQKDVASRLYMSQVQVSRLEKKILQKIKIEYIKQ